jgi:hypothetical protein
VPGSNQDHRSVPVAVAPQLGSRDQLLDLVWRRKVICTLPPSESDAASVWGRGLCPCCR